MTWPPDGERIGSGSRGDGTRNAFWIPGGGCSEPQPFVAVDREAGFGSFSPDGQSVATFKQDPATGLDLWVLPLKESRRRSHSRVRGLARLGQSFLQTGAGVYVSDESGQYEVYIRPYPVGEGKWQVSVNGGEEPIWSHDGKELFYRNGRE